MKLGIMGTPGRVLNLSQKRFKQAFSEVGGNTGNLVFQYAASRLTSNSKIYFNWHDKPGDINKQCSALLLPLANILGTHSEYSKRAEFINKIEVPIIVIGLGAQAHIANDASAENLVNSLTAGTIDFVKELSKKSEKILVRGEFTKKVCLRLGIENIEVFGCPSNLISNDVNLGEKISQKLSKLKTNHIVLNGGFYKAGKNNYDEICKIENMILSQTSSNVSIVVQGPNDIAKYSYGEGEFIERINDILGSNMLIPKLNSFYDINAWSHYIRSSDLSIGTRIHGSMVSLQHNHPSIIITHDSRTEELANLMQIPRIDVKTAARMDLRELIINTNFNPKKYNEVRYSMANSICNLLENYNLKPSTHLRNLQENYQ